jgi:FTR1 family protein
MQALVITFREGIEAALVIGIMLAFVRKTGGVGIVRWIMAGTVSAVIFSLAGAGVLGLSGISADNPIVEGVLFAVAAIAVASMVVWMWRNSRGVRGKVESQLRGIMDPEKSTRRIGVSLFLLAFFMVAREGVEAVLFIAAGAIGASSGPSLVIGGLAGLALAVVYGALFARGSARINLRLFFTMTSIVLVLLAVKLVGGSIHEFEEAGLIPMSESFAHFFDLFGGSAVIDWLFLLALIVPLAAPFVQGKPGTGRSASAHS